MGKSGEININDELICPIAIIAIANQPQHQIQPVLVELEEIGWTD